MIFGQKFPCLLHTYLSALTSWVVDSIWSLISLVVLYFSIGLSSGVQELTLTSWQMPTMHTSSQVCSQWPQLGSLESVMVGIVTPWNLQMLQLNRFFSLIYQPTTGYVWVASVLHSSCLFCFAGPILKVVWNMQKTGLQNPTPLSFSYMTMGTS